MDYQNNYTTVILNDMEDEMMAFTSSIIKDLKRGVSISIFNVALAECFYNSLMSLSGEPTIDYISTESINRGINTFNYLTNSTVEGITNIN